MAAWWHYEDHRYQIKEMIACAGMPPEEVTMQGVTYDDIRARLLRAEGPPRRHGRQPRRGVAVLPELPALLRSALRRAQGHGALEALRRGLQRLDGRRVVRRLAAAG